MDEDDKKIWDFVSKDIDKIDKNVKKNDIFLNHRKNDSSKENKLEKKKISWSEPLSVEYGISKITNEDKNKFCEIDRKTLRNIKKGKMVVEAILDMHGMTQDEAYEALSRFLLSCESQNKKYVLVITGKGEEGKGVLKKNTPLWLSSLPLSDMVKSFSTALPQDGGSGALYVFL